MPFEFDNVPLARLQIISLSPSILLLSLFKIPNTKDALSGIQATAIKRKIKRQACLCVEL
uniref:Uncharacterized protein n=1 Tax=Schistosoma japonicum TaxID=6182 RepID=Q5C5K2_SCHJA|nr:unknown [Schistosoma japonicum]